MNVDLMQHQKDAIDFALRNKGIAAFHHDPGCGKTLSALSTYTTLKEKEPDLKMLVICPISLIHGAWVKEIEKFTDFTWQDLHSDSIDEKFKLIPRDIFIINFEYLISIVKFNKLTGKLSSYKLMCVLDESSKIKNYSGVITKRLIGGWENKKYIKGIKDFCKYRIELSGTPAPNDYSEYWSQMKFLSDDILGPNFYKFRNQYFQMRRGRDIVPGALYNKAALREMYNTGYKLEFDETKREEFFNHLKPWCHVVKAKDCLDLPETVDEYRVFDMEWEQARVYKEMKNEYIAQIKRECGSTVVGSDNAREVYDTVIANIVLTKMIKLRQLTSNFCITEDGVARALTTKIPEKIKILLELVEECGKEQMIIWCQFRWEIARVVEELKKIGGVSELHGGINEPDRIVDIDNFINGSNRFLVANSKSAAHGLTFVNCRFATYFSLNYSYEEYEQSRKRIHRYGQTNKCVYFHILARNSVDEEVLAICQKKANKQDVAERFLKG